MIYFSIIEIFNECIELAKYTYDHEGRLSEMSNHLEEHPGMVYLTDENDNTLLHHAAENGNFRMCKLLMGNGANKDSRNHTNQTPFHLAEIHFKETEKMIYAIDNWV